MAKNDPPESPMETFWRATIMLGTLVVGGMAAYLYGPPPEKAGEMVDQVVARVQQWAGQPAEPTSAAPAAPVPALASMAPGPSPSVPPVAPALIRPPAAASPPDAQRLTAQLHQLGAQDVVIRPWGADGRQHRIEFAAPMPGGSGFMKRFDTIQESPTQAALVALAELRQWRGSL